MSLVTSYITFRIMLKDRGGNKVPMVFKSTATSTLTANTILNNLVAVIPSLTKAKIISATYTTGYEENDLSTDATNGEVEEKAELSVALVQSGTGAGQDQFGKITIPAPVDALFQAASGRLYNVVDPNNANLQTLLGYYVGSLVVGTLTLSDYQNIQDPTVEGNVVGKRIHKASRAG